MKRFFSLFVIILLSVSALFSQNEGDVLKMGNTMPKFTLQSEVYGNITSDMLDGKVVLITIFTTWCPPCQQELAALNKAILDKKIPFDKESKDFAVLVVGREHNDEELKAYQEKKQFSFPVYPDPKREFTSNFATKFIPRTYLINRKGEVIYTSIGFSQVDFDGLIDKINKEINIKK